MTTTMTNYLATLTMILMVNIAKDIAHADANTTSGATLTFMSHTISITTLTTGNRCLIMTLRTINTPRPVTSMDPTCHSIITDTHTRLKVTTCYRPTPTLFLRINTLTTCTTSASPPRTLSTACTLLADTVSPAGTLRPTTTCLPPLAPPRRCKA